MDRDFLHDIIFAHSLSKMGLSLGRLPFHATKIVSFAEKERSIIRNNLLPLVHRESSELVANKFLSQSLTSISLTMGVLSRPP